MKKSMKKYLLALITVFTLCIIFSSSAIAASTSISAKKATVNVGSKKTIYLKNNTKQVSWSTSKKSVASIKANGNKVEITGNKAGTATITAKIGKKKYSCKVTVKNAPKISKTKLTLNIKDTYDLTVTGTASSPKWSTSNKKVVSIKKVSARKYRLTAVKAGTATVKAKVNGKTLSCKVTVPSKPKSYGDTSNYNKNYKGDFDPRDVKNVVVPGITTDARQVGDVTYGINVLTDTGMWVRNTTPCCRWMVIQVATENGKPDPITKNVYLDPKDVSWVVENPELVHVKFYEGTNWQEVNKARGYGSIQLVVGTKGKAGKTRVHIYYKGLHWSFPVETIVESDPSGRLYQCSICGNTYQEK